MYTLMIVDDDEITRSGISRFLQKSVPLIQSVWTAQDGEEGLKLYEEYQPDFLLVDIEMPKMDGLELIEQLRLNGYQPNVIILSDHKNFSYAQSAVRLGVKEYLTKPIMPSDILRVINELIGEEDKRDHHLKKLHETASEQFENLLVLRERFFNSLIYTSLYEQIDEQYIKQRALLIDLDLSASLYMVVILRVASIEDSLKNKLASESLDSLFHVIPDPVFPEKIKCYSVILNEKDIALILFSNDSDREGFFKVVNSGLSRVLSIAKKKLNMIVCGGIGRQYDQISGICKSYNDALDALISIENNHGTEQLRNYEDISPFELFLDKNLLTEPETLLLHGVKYQSYEQCIEYVDQLFSILQNYWIHHCSYVKSYFLKVAVLIWRDLQNMNNGESDIGIDFSVVLNCEKINDCFQWFRNFLNVVVDSYKKVNEEKGNSLLNKARHIILDNFSNCDFNIDDVASQLFISSSYLRQIFKKQSNESFVEYLTRIRMENALELLQRSNLRIQEIAEQSGFANQRYFSVCFKKHYGKTPSECRS